MSFSTYLGAIEERENERYFEDEKGYIMPNKKMVLRPHQKAAVDETLAAIAFGDRRIVLDAATSWGKSFYAAKLADELPGKVAIVTNFTALISQLAEHLDELDDDYSILKAGMEDKFNPDARIHLIMEQTYYARRNKLDLKVDYVIRDECHVGWFGSKRADETFKALGEPVFVGMSGTPYLGSGYALPGMEMLIQTKTVKQLEKEGYLCPVKYFVPKFAQEIDYTKYSTTSGDYKERDIDEVVLNDAYMDQAINAMMKMKIDKKKTIVFCNSIKHAETVAKELREKGVKAYAYHSKLDQTRSEAIIESFRTNRRVSLNNGIVGIDEEVDAQVLCAVNKISIGFSVTDVQMGVMLRATESLGLHRQQIGRLIRIHQGKEYVELLDLAQNVSRHGFHDEPYSPPEYGNKEALAKAKEEVAAREIGLIAKEAPTEVNRDLVLEKVEELNRKRKKLHELGFYDLLAIYEQSQDPKEIIEIAFIINMKKTGQKYRKSSVEWAAETWYPMLDEFPEYKTRLLKSMKTRLKNIVSKGKKISAIKFFPEWLRDQEPYSYKKTVIGKNEYGLAPDTKIPF